MIKQEGVTRMKRLSMKKALCLLSVAALTLSAGCSNRNADGKEEDGQKSSPPKVQEGSLENRDTAMGRYVESETDLTEELELVSGMRKMPDGRLIISDRTVGVMESKDQGETWERMEIPWLDEKLGQAYIMDIQMAPDGTLAVIYDSMEETEGSEDEEAEDSEINSAFLLDPTCELIKPDGTVIPVTIPLGEGEMYPRGMWINDSGRIFVTTLGGDNIYEVNEDGSSSLLLTADGRPELIQFQDHLMIVDGYDYPAPLLFDLDKKEILEEEGMAAFMEENYRDRGFNGGSWYDLYIFPGEEGDLYFAGEKGMHCYHREDGSIEQLIDGKLSRLGSPLYGLKSMVLLEGGEFLSVSNEGKLIRFTYDPDMPSVPSESLKVYSLEDSYSIRTAVSLYQINHPEIYVDYEIGMGEGEAVTREDALKKLNTQIVSGEGPDLLMMDGLPMDSYIEKGLLLDLSDWMEEIGKEENLYENLYQAMAKDGKVYVVPAEVYLPVVLGREKYVSGMNDLASMADEICRMREDQPEKDLISICNEKALMKAFAPVAAPMWKNGSGKINEEAIAEFLTQTKRIYDAQMDGINEKSLEDHRMEEEYYAGEEGEDWMYEILLYGSNELKIAGDYQQLSVGVTTYPYGYYELTSVAKNQGLEDVVFAPAKGLCEKVFVPATMLGVNAASAKIDRAKEFFREFLGKEVQEALGSYGINKDALEELFRPEEEYLGEDGTYGMIATIDDQGRETDLTIYAATEEEMDLFRNWIGSADTPYIADMVMEKTVFEEGEKYMHGDQSLEEALEAIRQQLAIYLSE